MPPFPRQLDLDEANPTTAPAGADSSRPTLRKRRATLLFPVHERRGPHAPSDGELPVAAVRDEAVAAVDCAMPVAADRDMAAVVNREVDAVGGEGSATVGEDEEAEAAAPTPRPSERSTRRVLPGSPSMVDLDVLSASLLVDAASDVPTADAATVGESSPAAERLERTAAVRRAPVRGARRSVALALGAAAVLVVAAVSSWQASGASAAARAPRERRAGVAVHARLVTGRPSAWDDAPPPAGECRLAGDPVLVASRVRLDTALSAAVLPRGFVLAYAPLRGEVEAARIADRSLGVVERARTSDASMVASGEDAARVMIEVGDAEGPSLEARASTRSRVEIAAEGGEAFTVEVAGNAVVTRRRSSRIPVPAWSFGSGPKRAAALSAPAVVSNRASLVRPAGVQLAMGARGVPSFRAPPVDTSDTWLAAAARDGGGAFVALRRAGELRVGVLDETYAPMGPLMSVARGGHARVLGVPAVVAHGAGGVVAWAERAGDAFRVKVAQAMPGERVGTEQDLGLGMSPAIAELPDGDLLVAFAIGDPGARRIAVVRLAGDLAPRGTVLVVSPDGIDAVQPAITVRADGRGLVGYFEAADASAVGRVLAAPVMCDPGI